MESEVADSERPNHAAPQTTACSMSPFVFCAYCYYDLKLKREFHRRVPRLAVQPRANCCVVKEGIMKPYKDNGSALDDYSTAAYVHRVFLFGSRMWSEHIVRIKEVNTSTVR